LTGTFIIGKFQKIFTVFPEYYTLTDFNIHLTSSSEILKEMDKIKAIVPEL